MNSKEKINGFLYLPAAGLIISCFTGTFNAAGVIWLIVKRILNDIPTPTILALTLLASSVVYLIFLYVATFSFFRYKRNTRMLMITYYLVSFVINGGFILYARFYLGIELELKEIALLISIIFSVLVLLPYFYFSKRVPQVFCK